MYIKTALGLEHIDETAIKSVKIFETDAHEISPAFTVKIHAQCTGFPVGYLKDLNILFIDRKEAEDLVEFISNIIRGTGERIIDISGVASFEESINRDKEIPELSDDIGCDQYITDDLPDEL